MNARSLPLSFLSGILLFLSYPPFSLGFLAWAAFIPLFLSLEYTETRGGAFFTGWAAGFTFFFVGIQWLTHVTPIGWILLAAFEALFMGLFALLVFEAREVSVLKKILWVSLSWTATEFLRVKFPVLGFGWNLLGYSQAFYKTVVQSANTVGAYGLGFGIMMVNVCLYQVISDKRKVVNKDKERFPSTTYHLILIIIILVLVFAHGLYHQNRPGKHLGDYKISVVQGNIPQSVKWEAMARSQIVQIYSKLTELSAFEEPSLIIWPEAAFPGYLNRDFDAQGVLDLVRKIEIPVLIGAPSWEEGDKAYNSAFLVGPDGKIKQRYDKQNLVPFGEYIPMQWALGWLAPYAYSMGVSDFSAGHEPTVFNILNNEISFSTLICFEDTFPELARQFVKRGADFLTVITNDAWFGHTGAAAQHMQASIFRAVENGVPVVRAANTGISAFISNRGEILAEVTDEKGELLFVTGRKTFALPVDVKTTLHSRIGWLFPYIACAGFVIMAALYKVKGKRRKERSNER